MGPRCRQPAVESFCRGPLPFWERPRRPRCRRSCHHRGGDSFLGKPPTRPPRLYPPMNALRLLPLVAGLLTPLVFPAAAASIEQPGGRNDFVFAQGGKHV